MLVIDEDGDQRRLGGDRRERRDGEAVDRFAGADGDQRDARWEMTQGVAELLRRDGQGGSPEG
jgi:hypothetical protein